MFFQIPAVEMCFVKTVSLGRPLLVGWRPARVGWRPSPLGSPSDPSSTPHPHISCWQSQDANELAAILNWLGFAWSRDRMKAVLKEALGPPVIALADSYSGRWTARWDGLVKTRLPNGRSRGKFRAYTSSERCFWNSYLDQSQPAFRLLFYSRMWYVAEVLARRATENQ